MLLQTLGPLHPVLLQDFHRYYDLSRPGLRSLILKLARLSCPQDLWGQSIHLSLSTASWFTVLALHLSFGLRLEWQSYPPFGLTRFLYVGSENSLATSFTHSVTATSLWFSTLCDNSP